jgi:hypothetical protein
VSDAAKQAFALQTILVAQLYVGLRGECITAFQPGIGEYVDY